MSFTEHILGDNLDDFTVSGHTDADFAVIGMLLTGIHLQRGLPHFRAIVTNESHKSLWELINFANFERTSLDFSKTTQKDVDKAVKLLDNKSRKCSECRSPAEIFLGKPNRCDSD